LQLTELRAAEPSTLGPVKDDQDRLLALELTQIHGASLNRESADIRGNGARLNACLSLKREQ